MPLPGHWCLPRKARESVGSHWSAKRNEPSGRAVWSSFNRHFLGSEPAAGVMHAIRATAVEHSGFTQWILRGPEHAQLQPLRHAAASATDAEGSLGPSRAIL